MAREIDPRAVTLGSILHAQLSELMQQWNAEPYDVTIYSPCNLYDDLAVITIYLDFGIEYRKRSVVVKLSLYPYPQATIIATQDHKKPKKRKANATT